MDTCRIATDMGRVELLHAIPGRLRLRVPEIKGSPARAREVEQQVAGLKMMVRRVEANPVTGSILLVYDPDDSAAIAELGRLFLPELELGTLADPPAPVSDVETVTPSVVEEVVRNLRSMNAFLRMTSGGLDLRVLLPATLVLLGIKALVTDRERTPAWYNYFWFAFGTFCTLNRRATSDNEAPALARVPATVRGNGMMA
jgi:hypothetical protein